MSDEEDKKGFKVIDRRGSGASKDEAPTTSQAKESKGEGFVMNEAPEEPQQAPDQVDFSTLVFSFATGALIQMGLAPDPQTQTTKEKNLPMAKQNIGILEMLQKKTQGNLSEEEAGLLGNLLTELRLRFVEASK